MPDHVRMHADLCRILNIPTQMNWVAALLKATELYRIMITMKLLHLFWDFLESSASPGVATARPSSHSVGSCRWNFSKGTDLGNRSVSLCGMWSMWMHVILLNIILTTQTTTHTQKVAGSVTARTWTEPLAWESAYFASMHTLREYVNTTRHCSVFLSGTSNYSNFACLHIYACLIIFELAGLL